MFTKLANKWKVSGWRLVLILIAFAIGGSLSGYAARKLMVLLEMELLFLRIIVYVFLITFIWPLAVLIISLPFGQFPFFRKYILRTGNRLFARKNV